MKAIVAFAALPVLLSALPATAGAQNYYGNQGYYASPGYGAQGYGAQGYVNSQSRGSQNGDAYYGGRQDYGRYGQGGYYGGAYSGGYDYSYGGQRDVPGDYRCDAYWDRGRSDCNAGWRDQRGYGYGYNASYGRGGYGHQTGRNYYSNQSGRGYGRATTYYGAYGQPDIVYAVPTGGYGPSHGGYSGGYSGGYNNRNQGRIEWCRSAYRSYDPQSGYYRAYSGRLVYCG